METTATSTENEYRVCKSCGRELRLEHFSRNHLGYTHVCTECSHLHRSQAAKNRKKRIEYEDQIEQLKEQVEQAKADKSKVALSSFTPRELMEELARRGYKGKLTFTKVVEIDITNF